MVLPIGAGRDALALLSSPARRSSNRAHLLSGLSQGKRGTAFQRARDPCEDGAKHLRRQHAGIGVVARAVIAVEQDEAMRPLAGQDEFAAVAKGQPGRRLPECACHAVVGDTPERDDGPQIRHGGERRLEKDPAGADFERRRLVFRRHATHGISDQSIGEDEAVVGALRIDAGSETEIEQRLVKQVAREVAGEWASGTIGAAHAGRQADDEEPAG